MNEDTEAPSDVVTPAKPDSSENLHTERIPSSTTEEDLARVTEEVAQVINGGSPRQITEAFELARRLGVLERQEFQMQITKLIKAKEQKVFRQVQSVLEPLLYRLRSTPSRFEQLQRDNRMQPNSRMMQNLNENLQSIVRRLSIAEPKDLHTLPANLRISIEDLNNVQFAIRSTAQAYRQEIRGTNIEDVFNQMRQEISRLQKNTRRRNPNTSPSFSKFIYELN